MIFRLGIDCGASFTDVALLEDAEIVDCASIESHDFLSAFVKSFLEKNRLKPARVRIGFTGNPAALKEVRKVFKKISRVNEIQAIAAGARFLSHKKRFLCANIGTGTPFIFVRGKKAAHFGGTGVGGGTLNGLGLLLLGKKASELEALARKGKPRLDLTVGEILGSGIGLIPASATASNFGKIKEKRKARDEDVALSLIRLVAESVGVSACLAVRAAACKEIVFVGRVPAKNNLFRAGLALVTKMFGCRAFFPARAEYCTAIGAALLQR